MIAASKPLRSPLTWFGGKGHLARHIVPLLPPHECYVEPFFGGGSLFFAKPRARLETVSDLDGSVVRFYRVLRDPAAFERFRAFCELTPYAREEYEECRDTWGDVDDASDPARRAWAWFVGVRQAFGGATGGAERHGWKYSVAAPHGTGAAASAQGTWGYSATNAEGTRVASSAQRYLSAVERLLEVHRRLQGVQIERGDWRRVLAAYGHAGVLVYADPPYVWETRAGDKRYAHEMTTEAHHALTAALLASPAMVVLSGYRHAAVHQSLEEAGWERTDIDVPISAARHREGLRRVESLWRNPAAVAAWERARAQPSLFDGCDGIERAPQPGS
jgi:DNA adenine methylase